jgi:hypothetical protein
MVSTTGARPVQAPDELASLGLDWPPRRRGDSEKAVKGQMRSNTLDASSSTYCW